MVEMTFDNVVKYAYIGLRIGVIVMSLLSIFGFILLLANMDDSNLNLIGKFFSIVSYTSYMVVLLLILLTQFEYELFMKYLMVLYYRPVKCLLLIFMGVQILNTRAVMEQQDLDTMFQKVLTNLAGYYFVIAGTVYLVLTVLNIKNGESVIPDDGTGFKAGIDEGRDRGASATEGGGGGGGFFGKKKKKSDDRAESLIDGDIQNDVEQRPPPVTSGDGDFPFATDRPLGDDKDPFTSGPSKQADDTYAPPPVVVDTDIQTRRKEEDDELERMYAQAQTTQASSGFAAAD